MHELVVFLSALSFFPVFFPFWPDEALQCDVELPASC